MSLAGLVPIRRPISRDRPRATSSRPVAQAHHAAQPCHAADQIRFACRFVAADIPTLVGAPTVVASCAATAAESETGTLSAPQARPHTDPLQFEVGVTSEWRFGSSVVSVLIFWNIPTVSRPSCRSNHLAGLVRNSTTESSSCTSCAGQSTSHWLSG